MIGNGSRRTPLLGFTTVVVMKLHLIVLDNIKTALDGIVAWVIWLGSSLMQHNSDVIMSRMASQITSLTIVYSTIYSGADQRKHQSSASPAFVRGVHRWLVNSPHKWPVTQYMFPFDDVITSNFGLVLLWCTELKPCCQLFYVFKKGTSNKIPQPSF